MNRPTLAILRNSRLPGVLGECSGNLHNFRALVNEAQERLVYDPLAPDTGWWGGSATMAFTVAVTSKQAYLTTPRDVARLTDLNVCTHPVNIRNGFYEYLFFGNGVRAPGTRPTCSYPRSTIEAFERDSVATLGEFTGPAQLQVHAADAGDVGLNVVIQGKDNNGVMVTRTDGETLRALNGEEVELASPFVTTVNSFVGPLLGILKPPTLGRVLFYSVDPSTGALTQISTMEPGETTAQYRRYFFNELPNACYKGVAGQVTVTAQCKLEFIPAMSDADYLFIPNFSALFEECQAVVYGTMDSPNAAKLAELHHQKALRLLFGQLDHYLGKTKTALSCSIFGSDPLTQQWR